MFKKLLKKLFILIFILISILKLISGNCMSARSSASDADCYLNHLARENVMRMGMEGGCDAPRQQVVYPDDNSKMFLPRGTLLFRCNDHSGCCPQKEHTCQPISEEEIRVAFYAMDCNTGDSRPTPEYVVMKNHTRCGCRPPADDSFDPSPQRLQDMVCGGRGGKQRQSGYGYGQSSGYGQRSSYGGGYGGGGGGGYGQSSYGSQYGGSQQSPCSASMSSRPLSDGQVVRGTIRLTVGPKGFSMQNQQQQPCPYG